MPLWYNQSMPMGTANQGLRGLIMDKREILIAYLNSLMIEMSIGSSLAEPWCYMIFVSRLLTLILDAASD